MRGALETDEVIACRYRVLDCHRQHPLGELYRCVDETSDSVVMLQRLRSEFSVPDIHDRLFETRGSAALEHAAIDDLLDYGEDLDGRLFLVSRWRDQPSLADVERPLGFFEALGIIEEVAGALAPLHARGLVHGGIEPHNLLVDGERELCCLLDFGLVPALEAGAEKNRALPLVISPAYAAPELIVGQPLGPTADVYALGILLWELVFGHAPFRGPTLKILDAHLNRALPEVELPFDMPPSFEPVLRRMLAKNPLDRFGDATEVLVQVRRHVALAPCAAKSAVHEISEEIAVLEPDEDETVVFERFAAGTPSVAPPMLAIGQLPREVPRAAVRVAPVRRRPRWLAGAAMLSCVAVMALIGVSRAPSDAASPSAEPNAANQVLASALETDAEPQLAVQQVPEVSALADGPTREKLELPDIEAGEVTGHLSTRAFRNRKHQLYRRVNNRCVKTKMRRTVKVAVRVDERGEVEAATAMGGMGSSRLGRCVEQQARKLEFASTGDGGFYVYTLRIH